MEPDQFFSMFWRNDLITEIYNEYDDFLLTAAIRKCKRYGYSPELAFDFRQEVYLSMMVHFDALEKGYRENGVKYLMTMLRNVVINYWRKQLLIHSRMAEVAEILHPDSASRWDDLDAATDELLELVTPHLSEEDRLLLAWYLKGYGNKEIASLTNMNVSTVGVKIHRIKNDIIDIFHS